MEQTRVRDIQYLLAVYVYGGIPQGKLNVAMNFEFDLMGIEFCLSFVECE